MKNLIHSLAILLPCGNTVSHGAAAHLLAAEYVKEHPIPSPQEMDAEFEDVADAQTPARRPIHEYIDLGEACDDCTIAIANDDYSGMDEETAARVQSGIARVGQYLIVGDELGFSWRACTICGGLAGNRHAVGYIS